MPFIICLWGCHLPHIACNTKTYNALCTIIISARHTHSMILILTLYWNIVEYTPTWHNIVFFDHSMTECVYKHLFLQFFLPVSIIILLAKIYEIYAIQIYNKYITFTFADLKIWHCYTFLTFQCHNTDKHKCIKWHWVYQINKPLIHQWYHHPSYDLTLDSLPTILIKCWLAR